MATKILHIRLRVQIEDEPPQELIETYIKGAIEAPDKAYKQLKKVLPDVETVIEKIIKPSIKGTQDFLNKEAVTSTGTKIKDIPPPTLAEMKRRARKYLKRLKYAFRHKGKEWAEAMKYMAGYWAKTMLPSLAITGYQDEIRGVGPVAARCLTNVQSVLPLILPEEFIKKAPLVDITKKGQAGIFRKRFNSLILSVGKPIIANNYQPGDIIYANEQINRLVNEFARDEFVPFTPGGASHVDFIREAGELFLEIVVSVYE